MKMLDKLFRRAPGDLLEAESGFSRGDRKAIVAEFAEADAIERGLGAAIARYVITGDGESVLLRIDAVLAKGGDLAETLKVCLSVPQYAPAALNLSYEDINKRLAARRRILIDLEGFDAAGMRRLGLVQAKAAHWLYSYGTDRCPKWLRALSQASDFARNHKTGHDVPPFLTAFHIRDMLAVDGSSIAPLVDLLFGSPRYHGPGPEKSMADIVPVLASDPDAVCDEMVHLPARNRGIFINYLADKGLLDRVPAYFERIFLAAGVSAKATCEPALGALSKMDRRRVAARARTALDSAAVEERLAGVHALAEVLGGEALAPLDAHLAGEKAKKVVQAIEALRPKLSLTNAADAATRDDDAASYTAIDGSIVTAPPLRETADTIPADTEAVLRRLMSEAVTSSRIEWDKPITDNAVYLQHRGRYETPCDPNLAPQLVAIMTGRAKHVDRPVLGRTITPSLWHTPKTQAAFDKGLKALLARPDFGIKALTRLLIAGVPTWSADVPNAMRGAVTWGPAHATELSRRIRYGADFREVLALIEAAGFGAAKGIPEALEPMRWMASNEDADPPNPTVWPVFAAHFDIVDKVIAEKSALNRADGHAILRNLCDLFPKPPRRFLGALLDAAAGGGPVARRRARVLLQGAGDLTAVIVPLLKEAAASKRVGAARWLGERKDAAAVPVLRAALKGEKNIAAKAAILAALAACGDDISGEFAEATLAAEAKRERPKLKVDFSTFIDPAALPSLRWADGRAVDPAIVDYWLARAHKLKQPGGDPLLEMALERLDRDDAVAMGRTILSTFVQLDTRKATSDEANAYAESKVDAHLKAYQRVDKTFTRERVFASLRNTKLAEYLGSALDHRGLLALARFTPPGEAVAIVQRYLRDHGKRPNQCRALMEMLAADPIPQKLQLLLAAAKRHKQPGARKFAGTLVDRIADERGWTAAELADRTVPTLDLEPDGTLSLPIGEKAFRLRLGDDLALSIENPDGKTVAALPSPKEPDEAAAAKAAKASVSAARKELKQTVELQTARLYEAMCVARRWEAADFSTSFVAHPILSRLLRRLVLSGHDEQGALVVSARLLDDGTLSDVEDRTVVLDRLAQVGIAHRATLGDAAAAAWRQHFDDYDVTPLFSQLDRVPQPLADAADTEIGDRRGHAIGSFALRNAAAKRGYQPGGIMEASYSAYERIFPDLGLAASIGFSGDFVGNKETHGAAIHGLRFVRVRGGKPSEWGSEGIELGKVPPILLQEAWADYHAIAAAGTGFDPNWEKLGLW